MSTPNLIERALKESPYFQGLSGTLLSTLSNLAVQKRLRKGEHLFLEGEKAFGFYLVIEGLMKLYKLSTKGKEGVVHIFGPGEIFAEIILSGSEVYPVNAQALTNVVLAFFPKAELLTLLKKHPEFGLSLLGLFCKRLRTLLKTIENLTLKEAGERLMAYLWDIAEEGKKEELIIPIPKSQLALLLGITPETLSRLFQKLKEEGVLTEEGKKILVKDMTKFKSYIS